MKIIGSVLLLIIGFAGGFFAGLEVHDRSVRDTIRQDPMGFLTEYKEDFLDVARDSKSRYGEAWEHVKQAVGSLTSGKDEP